MAQRPSNLQLEQAFLSAWPALETHKDGGWVWRFANGYTKRANSAQSMDPGDEAEAGERLERFAEWARERGVPPTFRVTPLAGEKVITALNTAHWKPIEHSVVMAMPVGAAFTPKHSFRLFKATDPEWYEVQAAMSGYGGETVGALTDMLGRITAPVTGILVYDENGGAAAAALTNNNGGIGVYLNVVVRADLRGKGYGRSVMQAALNWSRDGGADWAAMQVVSDNVPALNLYRSLGFEEVYRYHYRRPE
ncbi:GNAT family N-acetyltransferase [Mariluticola halotolerans]|uniref:GNAT family N-acetyltransferase n=1 Tax=Mariluticola halotolerans TaxID=2909283 RepID=UPI0026E389B9|nr:GNAT family N-acetyltransferase [Mariluticola halotolerans]UJQ93846.1 GNAT family N-acetyltransferase [Mariluticola halotolerans]